MKKNIVFSLFSIALIILSLTGLNMLTFAAELKEFDDHYEAIFPAGSYFSVILDQQIDSSVNRVDDTIETYFPTDMYLGNMLVIPKGSKAIAKITNIERAYQGRNSLVNLKFYYIQPLGDKTSETMINAFVCDKNSDGSIGGQLTERKGIRLVAHKLEMIGTIDQTVPAGERAMGKEIYIPTGERWVIQLIQPATFIISK